jgi:hypothetical protein
VEKLTLADVRKVAVATFGNPGGHLVDLWAWYNDTLFGGELRPILISRSRVFAYGRCVGWTNVVGGHDPYRHIVVKAFGWPICAKQRAVLLHEMVHQFLFERGEDPHHDARPWCREIMRLSRELGKPIWAGHYTVFRNGKSTRRGNTAPPPELANLRALAQKEIANWPHSIRLFPPALPGR